MNASASGALPLVETTAAGDGSWTPERAETVLRNAAAVFKSLVD